MSGTARFDRVRGEVAHINEGLDTGFIGSRGRRDNRICQVQAELPGIPPVPPLRDEKTMPPADAPRPHNHEAGLFASARNPPAPSGGSDWHAFLLILDTVMLNWIGIPGDADWPPEPLQEENA